MNTPHALHRVNICKKCGTHFEEQSMCGNPYQWCHVCREKEYLKLIKLSLRLNNKKVKNEIN
jgi:hypothetical protein